MTAQASSETRTAKLGSTPRGRRIWLEGAYLARAGFTPGLHFTATITPGVIVCRVSPDGERTVSGKRGVPVIDMIGASIGNAFPAECARVQCVYTPGQIVITAAS